MITTEKLLPCICGKRAKMISGKYADWIACDGACIREVTAENAADAITMWNAAMNALRRRENAYTD